MKALSLKQPFAELVVSGRKKIELRNWRTKHRGEFYVHASKVPNLEAMRRFGFKENELPLGYIVGTSSVKDVKEYRTAEECEEDKDLHLADSSWGKCGFVLADSRRVDPIKARGMPGFWNYSP